jgi:hypothetical protein
MSREIRTDDRFALRSVRAFAVIFVSMGGTLVWGFLGGDKSPAFPVIFLIAIAVTGACIVHSVLPLAFYRCPLCGRRLPRVAEARPAVHYFCLECNVEWNLGGGALGGSDDNGDDDGD